MRWAKQLLSVTVQRGECRDVPPEWAGHIEHPAPDPCGQRVSVQCLDVLLLETGNTYHIAIAHLRVRQEADRQSGQPLLWNSENITCAGCVNVNVNVKILLAKCVVSLC